MHEICLHKWLLYKNMDVHLYDPKVKVDIKEEDLFDIDTYWYGDCKSFNDFFVLDLDSSNSKDKNKRRTSTPMLLLTRSLPSLH